MPTKSQKHREKVRRKNRTKLFLGVKHSNFNEYGVSGNLRNMRAQIKAIKEKGINRVGVEHVPLVHPGKGKGIRHHEQHMRYFYGLKLLLERNGIQPVEVDDPVAVQLTHVIDAFGTRHPFDLRGANRENYFKLSRYFENPLGVSMNNFSNAIAYYRTKRMIQNARKRGLNVIIGGEDHASDVSNVRYDKVLVDKALFDFRKWEKRSDGGRDAFKKYGSIVIKICNDIRSGKLVLEKEEW